MQQRSDLLIFFNAIKSVEGWTEGDPIGKAGEIGPYQITPAFYTDAVQQLEWEKRDTTKLKFRDLETDEDLCRRIILAYFRRYCFDSLKQDRYEDLARIFHRGPSALKTKSNGQAYWQLIKREMRNAKD